MAVESVAAKLQEEIADDVKLTVEIAKSAIPYMSKEADKQLLPAANLSSQQESRAILQDALKPDIPDQIRTAVLGKTIY